MRLPHLSPRLELDFWWELIRQGVNYATTFNVGWLIEVLREEKFALSANFAVTNGNYSYINLYNFVGDIIDDVPNSSLISSNNSLYGLSGIKAAYGFTHFIGLNIIADLGYGETIQRELENTWFTILGINADMNFSEIIKTPLSLSLGYVYSTYPKNNNDVIYNNNIFFAQLNYIGRTNFVLSLDVSFSKEKAGSKNTTIWLNTAMFSMRYLF